MEIQEAKVGSEGRRGAGEAEGVVDGGQGSGSGDS